MDVDGELWHPADLHSNVIRRAPRGLIIMFVWPFSWSTQAASLFWKPQQEHKQETACRLYVLRCRRPERRWEFQKRPSKLLHLCPLSSAAAATGHWNKEKCPPPHPRSLLPALGQPPVKVRLMEGRMWKESAWIVFFLQLSAVSQWWLRLGQTVTIFPSNCSSQNRVKRFHAQARHHAYLTQTGTISWV